VFDRPAALRGPLERGDSAGRLSERLERVGQLVDSRQRIAGKGFGALELRGNPRVAVPAGRSFQTDFGLAGDLLRRNLGLAGDDGLAVAFGGGRRRRVLAGLDGRDPSLLVDPLGRPRVRGPRLVGVAVAMLLVVAPAAYGQVPTQDSVVGSAIVNESVNAPEAIWIDAHSAPNGENPTGTVSLSRCVGTSGTFCGPSGFKSGTVTCLNVSGNRAVVGWFRDSLGGNLGVIGLAEVVDNGVGPAIDHLTYAASFWGPETVAPYTQCPNPLPTNVGGTSAFSGQVPASPSDLGSPQDCDRCPSVPNLQGRVQERRLAQLRIDVQEPGRLRQLRRDEGQEPASWLAEW
jgi:hypothetical protein